MGLKKVVEYEIETVPFLSSMESWSNKRKVFIQCFCLEGTIITLSSKFIYSINRKKCLGDSTVNNFADTPFRE